MTVSPARPSRSKRKLGSVFQRKQDGRRAASVTLPDGRRVTRYVSPDHPTPERGAHELLAKLITETGAGEMPAPVELTVERWLSEYLKPTGAAQSPR